MKKAVVLLLTLFFITAISALILKNLDDTDIFLEKQSYIINNTQVLIAVKNVKDEVAKLIKKYKDDIDEALENELLKESFPIKINTLDINFDLKKYEKANINQLQVENSKVIEKVFLNNDIFDYDVFKRVYFNKLDIVNTKEKNNKKVETNKQLDDIIDTYITKSYNNNEDSKISRIIKNEIGFLENVDLYELNINVKFNSSLAFANYLLDKEGMVKYFDISFK